MMKRLFSNWKIKEYLFAVSIVANVILCWWIYDLTKEDQKPNEELLKSQGRVEVLEEQVSELQTNYGALEILNDSLEVEIDKKPKERIVIQKIYDEKINSVINLSLDSTIGFISDRLSEVDFD